MMKKYIHIYSQYYSPVSNACSNRVEHYVFALKDCYDIKIITGIPNYPTGIKNEKYKWRLFKNEIGYFGENIIRTYEFATKNEGSLGRMLNYISFMCSSFLYGLFAKKPDIIIVTSPPLFTALSVLLLHKIRKIPYILEIRDLWPDSIVALGYMKENSMTYKIFSWLEKKLYKNADKIIGVTKGICETIKEKGIDRNKVILQYNISEEIDGKDLKNPYCEFGDIVKGKKISLFAGNMNEAYDFYKTYEYIQNNQDVFFVFIGDGSGKLSFENKCRNLENILFLERKSKIKLRGFIYYSDIFLVPLRDEKFYKGTFPVKGIEGIVNKKEIVFFGPKNGEFGQFLIDFKNGKEDGKKLKFEYFIENILLLVK